MPLPTSEAELAALLRALGAPSPEQWARSQVAEGIPQLLRFLFLKHAWARVIHEGDTEWIETEIENSQAHPKRPFAGLGAALARCKAKGASPEDLSEIARCLQAAMLFAVANIVDEPPYEPGPLEDLSWGLFQTNEEGRPFGPQIGGLHESVLQLDPSGREMRPRDGT